MSSAAPTREVIPPEIDRHRIAWLTTEDRHGWTALTKIRFATDGGKLYTTLRQKSVALRQIQNQPQVRISLGKGNQRVKGPEISGLTYVVPRSETTWARHLEAGKYWLLRIPFFRSRQCVPIEITLT